MARLVDENGFPIDIDEDPGDHNLDIIASWTDATKKLPPTGNLVLVAVMEPNHLEQEPKISIAFHVGKFEWRLV